MTCRELAGLEMSMMINLGNELLSPQSDKVYVDSVLHEVYSFIGKVIQREIIARGFDSVRAGGAVRAFAEDRIRTIKSDAGIGWKLWGCLQDDNWRPMYPLDEFIKGVAA